MLEDDIGTETPPRGKLREGLARTRKELMGRFYQLLSGHAATAKHLRRVGQSPTDRCWWCGSGEKQTRSHLLVKCRRWGPEIRRLWKRVEMDCGWGSPRAPSVRLLFRDTRATPALEFLEDTRVGRMPDRVLLAGGPYLGEGEMEEVELWAPEEEEATGIGGSRVVRRMGLAHPLIPCLSFVFLCFGGGIGFLLSFVRRHLEGEQGNPTMAARASPG